MDMASIIELFDDLNIWKHGDQRAPHKPLLMLYALGRLAQGDVEVSYRQVEKDVSALLREFGPPRKSDHPEQPFWRLQRDGVWTVYCAGLAPAQDRR
jgi:putative restriction endonuclease